MMPDGQENVRSTNVFPGPDGDGQPSGEELFDPRPAASPAEVRNTMLAELGHDVPRPPGPPEYPGIHQLAQDLGLA